MKGCDALLSLRCKGDYLEIKSETILGKDLFRKISSTFRGYLGSHYNNEDYTWYIPTAYVDDIAKNFEDIIAWHNSIEEIKGIEEVLLPDFAVSEEGLDDFKLRPYPFQVIGISFLCHVQRGVIADEMGLGKTIQTMGAAHRLWREEKVNKVLVVCPASLKYQWKNEIEKFTSHQAIVIDGTKKQRLKQLQSFQEEDILFAIVNYELVRNMADELAELPLDVVIADEAHRIKSRTSATYKAMMKLQPTYRFASTGTPMQNTLEELHTLMSWVDGDVLGNITNFRKRYMVYAKKFNRYMPIGPKRQGEVRRKVSNHMLRRKKKEVAKELPELLHHPYHVEMTSTQKEIYEKIQADFSDYLEELREFEPKGEMRNGEWVYEKHPKEDMLLGYLNLMLAVANDPYLLCMSDSYMSMVYRYMVEKDEVSPKIQELVNIAEDQLNAGNKKIVIFTQFTRMQSRVVEALAPLGKCEIINGSMKPLARQEAIDRFRWQEDTPFLVLTDAGNYGLNLQFANLLINVECPYNPATVDQRNGRVHRLGGEHSSVNIIYLIARGTIDEKIQKILEEKRKLSDQVIERNDAEKEIMDNLLATIS